MLLDHLMIIEKSCFLWPTNMFNTILDFIRMVRVSTSVARKITLMMMKTQCLVLSTLTLIPKIVHIKGSVEVKQWEANMNMATMEQLHKPSLLKQVRFLDFSCMKKLLMNSFYRVIANFIWIRKQLHLQ